MLSYINHSGIRVTLDSNADPEKDCGGDCVESGHECDCPSCEKAKKKKKKALDSLSVIGQVISKVFDAPVDEIVSANYETGYLDAIALSDNKLFRVREDSDGYLSCKYLPGEATQLNQFAQNLLAEEGIRCDSNNAFIYARGFFNQDGDTPHCAMGNTPCGQVCLPKTSKCRKGKQKPKKPANPIKKITNQLKKKLEPIKHGLIGAGIGAGITAGLGALSNRNRGGEGENPSSNQTPNPNPNPNPGSNPNPNPGSNPNPNPGSNPNPNPGSNPNFSHKTPINTASIPDPSPNPNPGDDIIDVEYTPVTSKGTTISGSSSRQKALPDAIPKNVEEAKQQLVETAKRGRGRPKNPPITPSPLGQDETGKTPKKRKKTEKPPMSVDKRTKTKRSSSQPKKGQTRVKKNPSQSVDETDPTQHKA